MKERIAKIIKTEKISSSKFADSIGVQRSSISHILSGRNNPSLDFIQKILTVYDKIDSDWLLFGKGTMYKNENSTKSSQTNLFQRQEKEEKIAEIKKSPERIVEPPVVKQHEVKTVEKIINPQEEGKKVERIVLFYTDKTFKEYSVV